MSVTGALTLLSPHPDDLCFSVGGVLAEQQSTDALAVVAFTLSRYAPLTPEIDGDLERVTTMRTREDERYLESVGVVRLALDLPDCTGRTSRLDDCDQVDCPPEVFEELLAKLTKVVDDRRASTVYCPLAIGGNRDHIALRDAALQVVPLSQLVFYEDLPYAGECPPEDVDAALAVVPATLSPVVMPIRGGVEAKVAAAAQCYPSQLHDDWRDAIASHARSVGGTGAAAERLWFPTEV